MDKRRAIQIMTSAAALYRENLEDQKVLFLYGVPSIINKQLQAGASCIKGISAYEVVFHRNNFLHLTGVKINNAQVKSAIHFYEKCLGNRLLESDFQLARDGSSGQKLDILEGMMSLKRNATMIGDFTDRGPKLYAEKVAGNVGGCIGFVEDKCTRLNVPNTLLKKDIRTVTARPVQKIYAVLSKQYTESKYSEIVKQDKNIDISKCIFADEIEGLMDRDGF